MNQNYIDQSIFSKQFYRAFGNYFGPQTSTPSLASEYQSSTRTQTANLNKQNSLAKPITSPQNVNKQIHQNIIRLKTQTQHIPKQQTIIHHIKSLSSDLKNQSQQKRYMNEKIISQSEKHPFLIIQKKARELKKIESRKGILPSIYNDSQYSARLPEISPSTQIPIIQITEPLQQHLSKEQECESDKDDDSLIEDDFPQGQQRMKKLSVRIKFKNAVQSQVSTLFINKQPKSLFNVIISPEFTLKHEEERQKISDAFEAGNFILYKAKQFQNKQVTNNKKIFITQSNIKHSHKMNSILNTQITKLNTTNKAFLRKIKMILTTSENNKDIEQPSQKISFLSKYKKSQLTQSGTNEYVTQGINLNKNQFTITITNHQQENQILIFQRPKFLIQVDQINEEISLALSPPKITKSPSRRILTNSGSLHSSQKQIHLRHSVSQQIIKEESSNVTFVPIVEEINNLDFNQEFSKSNLYVRLYYQSKLHKLPRKTTFIGINIQEIEDYFTSQQQLIKLTNINFQATEVPGFEQIGSTLQQNLEIPKYIIQQPKLCLNFNLDQTEVFSSSESDQSLSLDLLLEEPIQSQILNKFRSGSQQQENGSQLIHKIQSLNNLEQEKDETIFVEDDIKNWKTLSTGQLTLIKKVRNNFLQQFELRCILNTLDQKTKNQLLTFPQQSRPLKEILDSIHFDSDSSAFNQLEQYNNMRILTDKIVFQLEMRYNEILIGRYQDYKKIIDIEHQDLIDTLEHLLEIPKLEDIEKQSKSQKSQQQQLQNQKQQKQQPSSITNQQIKQITNIKQNLHNKKQLKKNQTQTINIQPNLKTKQTNNSPDQNNSKLTMQYSNQLTNQQTQNNNNIITQSTTQYLTKPTNQSQQSVIVSGSKTIQKSQSNADLSETSSIKSSNSRLDISSQNIIDIDNQKIQSKMQQFQEQQNDKKLKHNHTKSENLINKIFEQKVSSMQQHALRMRSHAEEQTKRQKYDQKYQIKFAIEDNNFQEFMENFLQLPEMYIDYRFKNNETFLTLATQSGNKEIVKELIRRGADINIQNDDGNTPLHLAIAYSHYIIADMLMFSGASSNILNKLGRNAWNVI